MELFKFFTLVGLAFGSLVIWTTEAKRSDRTDTEQLALLPRPHRTKHNVNRSELFSNYRDPDSSAQGISPQISYNSGQLGAQNGLLGNQGLYSGLQGFGLGGNSLQNPYLTAQFGGLGGNAGGLQGLSGLGGQNNLYSNPLIGNGANVIPGGGQDIYSQQGGIYNTNPYLNQNPYYTLLGGGTFGGTSHLGGIGNPYLSGSTGAIGNPYLGANTGGIGNPYLGGAGGIGNPYLGATGGIGGINPYLLNRNTGYLGNPYLTQQQGFLGNPYGGYQSLNPYNAYPFATRFGLGRGGSIGSNTRNTGTSSSQSSSDE